MTSTETPKPVWGERAVIEVWRWLPCWANALCMIAMIGAQNWPATWFAFVAVLGYASYIHQRDYC